MSGESITDRQLRVNFAEHREADNVANTCSKSLRTSNGPEAVSEAIRNNLKLIYERVASACMRVGRDPSEVTLLPVSKTKPAIDIREAYAAGLTRFGENKVQEAQSKAEEIADLPLQWCIIGNLQTNKAKYVARFAAEVHSLDRLKLAQELDKRLEKEGRQIDVLVQVNTSNEPQKYGLDPEEVPIFAKELPHFHNLRVKGLMTLALLSEEEPRVRHCFAIQRRLQERLRQEGPDGLSWDVLSMGMSRDFEIAIEEGSTEVRVGQALFGARPLPDSHYWPT